MTVTMNIKINEVSLTNKHKTNKDDHDPYPEVASTFVILGEA